MQLQDSKAWWQSKTILAGIATLLVAVFGMFNVNLEEATISDLVVAMATFAGGAGIVIGRVKAWLPVGRDTFGKEWWSSRTVFAAIVTIFVSLAAILGIDVDQATIEQVLLSGSTVVTGLIALWGRITARTKIGAP